MLHLISHVHLASFAIMPPRHLKYSTVLSEYQTLSVSYYTIRDYQWWRLWVRTACSMGRHLEHFRSKHSHLRDTLREHQNCSIINMENGMFVWHMDCSQPVSHRHLIAKAPVPGQSTCDLLWHQDRSFPYTHTSTNHRCDINFVSRALPCNTHCITWHLLELKAKYQALLHVPLTQ